MADKPRETKRKLRKVQTVREQVNKPSSANAQPRRLRRTLSAVTKPVRAARQVGKKEYYLPLPDSKPGRFLNKRRHFIPSYFRNSFKELRDVKWPNRKQTTQLTLAVFIFATIFGLIIAVTDYSLDKIFKAVLLK